NHPDWEGVYPGVGNLRDLGEQGRYATKFVQHSGPVSLPIFYLNNKFLLTFLKSSVKDILYSFSLNRDDYPPLPRRSHVSSIKSNCALAKSKGSQSTAKGGNRDPRKANRGVAFFRR
ncbi:MAG: hypothetical protein VXW13_08375, partial [SAR324 cluster bacterium]|nr:hypothetical protein [SAR324 cluster bacterium]